MTGARLALESSTEVKLKLRSASEDGPYRLEFAEGDGYGLNGGADGG
jgi:hypothetical protein